MFDSKNGKIALSFGLHDRPLKLPQGALRLPLFLRSLCHWIVVVTLIRKLRVEFRVAITGHGPTSPAGSIFCHWSG
ncbi:hypothetical protein AVEN_207503-1, partial [Araneus ventricosus]